VVEAVVFTKILTLTQALEDLVVVALVKVILETEVTEQRILVVEEEAQVEQDQAVCVLKTVDLVEKVLLF
jgi:hypothetical protein